MKQRPPFPSSFLSMAVLHNGRFVCPTFLKRPAWGLRGFYTCRYRLNHGDRWSALCAIEITGHGSMAGYSSGRDQPSFLKFQIPLEVDFSFCQFHFGYAMSDNRLFYSPNIIIFWAISQDFIAQSLNLFGFNLILSPFYNPRM